MYRLILTLVLRSPAYSFSFFSFPGVKRTPLTSSGKSSLTLTEPVVYFSISFPVLSSTFFSFVVFFLPLDPCSLFCFWFHLTFGIQTICYFSFNLFFFFSLWFFGFTYALVFATLFHVFIFSFFLFLFLFVSHLPFNYYFPLLTLLFFLAPSWHFPLCNIFLPSLSSLFQNTAHHSTPLMYSRFWNTVIWDS